jgi:amidase
MGKTLEDVTFYSKAVIYAEPWKVDPNMLPIPWRAVMTSKKLKVAILWNDGMGMPIPPVTRALKETVDWDPKLHPLALEFLVCRSGSD